MNGDIPETHKEKRKWVRQKEKKLGQKRSNLDKKKGSDSDKKILSIMIVHQKYH
jgi:hypothetical protein